MTFQKIEEWKPLVVTYLINELGKDTFIKLCNLLKKYDAIIAGGSILKAVSKYDSTANNSDKWNTLKKDIDIYVNTKNIPSFLTEFQKITQLEINNVYWASTYCLSFLRKNGIRRVYQLSKPKKMKFDVMSVRNKRTLLDVVTNFDLTFCQVWFDGDNVYATHPDDIRKKEGSLQHDYIATYHKGNRFLKERIKKYEARGFKINIDSDKSKHNNIIFKTNKCYADNGKKISINNYDKLNDEEKKLIDKKVEHWIKSVCLKWVLNMRDANDENNNRMLEIPLKKPSSTKTVFNEIKPLLTQNEILYYNTHYTLKDDDGYDSEDIDKEDLIKLSVDSSNSKVEPELIYGRTMFNLLINYLKPIKDKYNYNFGKILEEYPFMWDLWAGKYFEELKKYSLRKNSAGEELYDIHEHKLSDAITQKKFEEYLEKTLKNFDKDTIQSVIKANMLSCYNKDCKEKLSLYEVNSIISRKFSNTFIIDPTKKPAPPPPKTIPPPPPLLEKPPLVFINKQNEFLKTVSLRDKQILRFYTYHGDRIINQLLRGNMQNVKIDNPVFIRSLKAFMLTNTIYKKKNNSGNNTTKKKIKDTGIVKEFMYDFLNVVNKFPKLEDEITVYRGVTTKEGIYTHGNEFLSTSYDKFVTNKFKVAHGCCELNIKLKPGVKAIYMVPISQFPNEREILIVPPFKFHIDSIENNNNTYNITISPIAKYKTNNK